MGMGVLAAAAISDVRTRKVNDWHWIIAGIIGFGLLAYEIMRMEVVDSGGGLAYVYEPAHLLILVAIGIPYFYAVLPFGDEPEKDGPDEDEDVTVKDYIEAFLPIVVPIIFVFLMVWQTGWTDATIGLVSIYAMVVVAHLFFYTGLLHGGADAKAFMAVAVLVPFYPILAGFPLIAYPDNLPLETYSAAFPFVFLVFMNGAIINVLIAPVVNLPRNLASGDRGGMKMLFGFRMNVDDVLKQKTYVWPMEVMRDGELVTIIRKVGEVDNIPREVAALKEAGIESIWVQRKYPFIVAILAGFVFSFVVGNVLMLIY